MPPGYAQIRSALSAGFSVDNLRNINLLILNALCSQNDHRHPAALLMIAEMAGSIEDAWHGKPLHPDIAHRIEHSIRPRLEALLDLAESDASPSEIMSAMNEAAREFSRNITQGLDSNLG